jgi:hypothetical protein
MGQCSAPYCKDLQLQFNYNKDRLRGQMAATANLAALINKAKGK